MSFSFNAAGTRDEAAAQLQVQAGNMPDGLGKQVAELAAAQLLADEPGDWASDGGHRYVVKAYGHSGGGSPLSLGITIEPLWVPVIPPPSEPTDEQRRAAALATEAAAAAGA
jgi:hypothetical protein